jgi:uncharacterized membrane protein
MTKGILAHIRRGLVRGLFMVLPLLITVWLLGLLFSVVNATLTPWVQRLLEWAGVPGIDRALGRHVGIPIVGLLLTVLFVYLLGLLGGNLAARRVITLFERLILRVPLVKSVYGSARQLLDAFSFGGKRSFSRVVMIEYPRRRLFTLGFVTTDVEHCLSTSESPKTRVVPVFLPTTPNPTSGWMILVPIDELVVLDMTVEDAIKMIVSGGMVGPAELGDLQRPWELSHPPATSG